MDPKKLRMYLDWVYEEYMTYGPGHASTWARMIYEELQAEVEQLWKELEQEKLEQRRQDIDMATRWAGHNAVEIEA